MSRAKYLFKNTIIFAIGNLSTKFISFLMVPLYTYVLTQSEYGTVDLIFTLAMVITPIIMMNIAESVMRFSLDKDANHNNILRIAFVITILGSVISLIFLPIINSINILSEYTLYIYLLILSSAVYPIPLAYLKGKNRLKLYTTSNIMCTFLMSILNILFLVVFKFGIKGYLLANILSYSSVAIMIFFTEKMYRSFNNFHIDRVLFKEMFKYSIALVPNSLLWWITNSADRFMVTYYIGLTANGLYAVAYKLPSLLSTICGVYLQAWQLSAIKEKDSKDNEQFTNVMYDNLFRFLFIIGSLMIFVLKPLLKIYVNESFYISWKFTPVLILGFVISSLSTFVGTHYDVEKNSVGNMFSALSGAVINVILNFILIPLYGVNGASIATCVSYFIVFVYRVIDTRKYIKLNLLKKDHIITLIIHLLIVITVYIDNLYGYILMGIELICLLLVNKIFLFNTLIKFKNIILIRKLNNY